MSLDLTVLKGKRFSEQEIVNTENYLLSNGFKKERELFICAGKAMSADAGIDNEADEDEYWDDSEYQQIFGFIPMAQISLSARAIGVSLEMIHHIAWR